MPVQSGEITNILLLLQGQHQCVLVALAKTVSQFTQNCTHVHPAPAHRVSNLPSLLLPCEAGTNSTYTTISYSSTSYLPVMMMMMMFTDESMLLYSYPTVMMMM